MAERAEQPITGLPVKTSSQVSNLDKLLGIDSSEGYQISVNDFGKYLIEHSTTTLAGSSQTVQSAINGLNSNSNRNMLDIETVDCDTVTTPGIKRISESSTNSPEASILVLITTTSNSGQVRQEAYPVLNAEKYYVRRGYNSYGVYTFQQWIKYPTRSEVDTLNSNLYNPDQLGTFGTLEVLSTLLDAKLESMMSFSNSFIRVTASATVGPFLNTYSYYGTLYKSGTSLIYSHAILYPAGVLRCVTCSRDTNGWSFESIPIQADVDTLTRKMGDLSLISLGTVGGNTSKTFTVSSGSRLLCICNGTHTGIQCVLIISVNVAGTSIYVSKLAESGKGDSLTYSTSENTITITNGTASDCQLHVLKTSSAGGIQ